MPSNVRAFLITNPKAGRGRVDLSAAITVLQAHGWEVAVRQKLHGGDATDLAREAVRAGYNVVVDCGGDGTLNEIVEGVVGTGAAVGVIPGGTANLWAHEVGISPSPEAAALQLVGAEQHRVDVGRVAVNGHHKRHFLLVAGLGLDGAVLGQLSKPLKKRVGVLAYAPATLRALRTFRTAHVDVDMDGVQWHGYTAQVVVANTRRYGRFTQMCPRAYMDDGLLDICLLTPDSAVAVGRQIGSMLLRQRPSPTSAHEHRATTITIRSEVVLPLEVDGGSVHLAGGDLTPEGVFYTFSLTAQGVSVLVPRTYNGDLFEPRRFSDVLADIPLRPIVAPVPQPSSGGHNGHAAHNGHHRNEEQVAHNGHDSNEVHGARDGQKEDKLHEACVGHSRHEKTKGERVKTWKMRVLSVGIDWLAAAYVKNGRVVQVSIPSDAVVADATGKAQSLWGALSTLIEGDLVEIEGVKDADRKLLVAHRVILPERTPFEMMHKHGRKP